MRLRSRHGKNPEELGALDVETYLDDKTLKRKFVNTMFDILAPGYDAFTRIFSFGMDRRWKARLIEEGIQRAKETNTIVDLACGTGDFAFAITRHTESVLILGLDFSLPMLQEAQRRAQKQGVSISFSACDILQLGVRSKIADVVSIGYGLRNTSDVSKALSEIARIIKPGGVLINLDFYKPAGRLWRELFLWYMWQAGRVAGWIWHREPIVYGYLAPSIRRYLTIVEFEDALIGEGFKIEWRQSRLGGAVGLHVARKMPQ